MQLMIIFILFNLQISFFNQLIVWSTNCQKIVKNASLNFINPKLMPSNSLFSYKWSKTQNDQFINQIRQEEQKFSFAKLRIFARKMTDMINQLSK